MAVEAAVVIAVLLLMVVALHQLAKDQGDALPPPDRRYVELPTVRRRQTLCGCWGRQKS